MINLLKFLPKLHSYKPQNKYALLYQNMSNDIIIYIFSYIIILKDMLDNFTFLNYACAYLRGSILAYGAP